MKHTKKLLAAVMAFAMVSAIAPMSAFADTQVKQDSSNQSGDMIATYDVKAKYTVTIPAGVTLDSENSVTANFKASEVMLESGQKIKVTLNSADHTESGATFHAQTERAIQRLHTLSARALQQQALRSVIPLPSSQRTANSRSHSQRLRALPTQANTPKL